MKSQEIMMDWYDYESYVFKYGGIRLVVDDLGCTLYPQKDTLESQKYAILNLLSYCTARPSFLFTSNFDFNQQLQELYLNFEIHSMLALRNPNYFKKTYREILFQMYPLFNKRDNDEVFIESIPHPKMLELYGATFPASAL